MNLRFFENIAGAETLLSKKKSFLFIKTLLGFQYQSVNFSVTNHLI